jgi:ketosteroid isomerase-like protein
MNIMRPTTAVLRRLYEAFNRREVDTILAMMQPDVKWANGMEGGFVHGREAVREYWRRQFEVIRGQLEPLTFETDENDRSVVTVHLVARNLQDEVVVDRTATHFFTFEDGLISVFEIGDSEPLGSINR